MTFEEWLEEKLDRAEKNANESWLVAPASYGCGWDKGYEAALQDIFAQLPARVAFSPMESAPSPQENADG